MVIMFPQGLEPLCFTLYNATTMTLNPLLVRARSTPWLESIKEFYKLVETIQPPLPEPQFKSRIYMYLELPCTTNW